MTYTRAEEIRAAILKLKERTPSWVDWLAGMRRDWAGSELLDETHSMLAAHAAACQWPVISADPRVQASYAAQRIDGSPHNFAEMVCLASPPMSNTDREFLEGRGGCYDQFSGTPWVGDAYRKSAEAAGVSTTGKLYMNGLARFPGDPEAWICDRSDVKRVVEQRGWSCQGAVNVQGRGPDTEPTPGPAVADDILDGAVAARLEDNPDLARGDRADLRNETLDMIKPHWTA